MYSNCLCDGDASVWAEQVQRLQKWLLLTIQKDHPSAMYPAAICALADLIEVSPALQLLT